MGQGTQIAWTGTSRADGTVENDGHTFNPWIGCQKVSPACESCYAEVSTATRSTSARIGLKLWGPPKTATRYRTSAGNWRDPFKWNAKAKADGVRRKVFCASLADVFEENAALDPMRADLWPVMEKCDDLDWLVLTKRPENITRMVPPAWLAPGGWPAHVWVGTTVEDQKRAAQRIPELLKVPARVRFLSCEPLLEAADLDPPLCPYCRDGGEVQRIEREHDAYFWCVRCESEAVFGNWLDPCADERQSGISWVIVGGESGPGARPFALEWARDIVTQCREAGVACFVKQMGDNAVEESRVDVLNERGGVAFVRPASDPDGALAEARALGRTLRPHRVDFRAHHGADPAEWPADLRTQEFPR
jgi:protein gp37